MTTQRRSLTFGTITWYYGASANAWPAISPNSTIIGVSGANNAFYAAAGDILIGGGGGGDNFFSIGPTNTAIAGVGDGIDTITNYTGNLSLPTGFSNGILSHPGTITGNSGNNILTVTGSGAHTLRAGMGNDVLIGSPAGPDRFVISEGAASDVIMGFIHGKDTVELDNFTTLQQSMTQVGADVVLNLGNNQTLTFAAALKSQFTANDFALPINLTGFQLTFDDEFNTFSASPTGLTTNWSTTASTLAHEEENYTASPFSLNNGILDISATPVSTAPGLPYTSGEITTKRSFAQTYGYFEMRAQLPAGQGLWPAFWLLPADGSTPSELDVMEVLGNDPTTIHTATHSKLTGTTGIATLVGDTSAGFHTYGVDWEPDRVIFYVDGNAINSLPTPADMNKPMYMIVNLAVGGPGSWPGAATGESGNLLVDYVRAYASPTAVQPPLMLLNAGDTIRKGDGNFSVTGTGWGGWIILGNGNQTIQLTGPQAASNTIVTGNGNQSISLVGTNNSITTGTGTSTIQAGTGFDTVTVGATMSGITTIGLIGYKNIVTATGSGNFSISGSTTGSATISLLDGNDSVVLAGSANTVTIGYGTSVVSAGTGQAIVHTGGGASTITAAGWTNLLDAGPGMNFLNGGAGHDTFVLNGPGQGLDTISSFQISTDMLDLTRALSGLAVAADLSNITAFVSTQIQANGTMISIQPNGAPSSAQSVAFLSGVSTTLSDLLTRNHILIAGKTI